MDFMKVKPEEPCWTGRDETNRRHLSWQVAITAGFETSGGQDANGHTSWIANGKSLSQAHGEPALYDDGCKSLISFLAVPPRALRLINRIAGATSLIHEVVSNETPGAPTMDSCRAIVRALCDEIGAAHGFIGLLDHTTAQFDVAMSSNETEDAGIGPLSRYLSDDSSLVGWVINTKCGFLSNDIDTASEQERINGWFKPVPAWNSRSVLAVPLLAEYRDNHGDLKVIPLGALCFEDPKSHSFDEEDLVFLLYASRILAAKILPMRRWEGLYQAANQGSARHEAGTVEEFRLIADRILKSALCDLRGANSGMVFCFPEGWCGPDNTKWRLIALCGEELMEKGLAASTDNPEDSMRPSAWRRIEELIAQKSRTLEACTRNVPLTWNVDVESTEVIADVFPGAVSTIAAPIFNPLTGELVGAITIESCASRLDPDSRTRVPHPTREDRRRDQLNLNRIDIKEWRREPFHFRDRSSEVAYVVEICRLLGPVIATAARLENLELHPQRPSLGQYYVPSSYPRRPELELLVRIAAAARTVLNTVIIGPRGTGKTLLAKAIHLAGGGTDQTWRHIDISAHPVELVEDALFGHAKGAFTGATADRAGVLEAAQDGTVFIDEIHNLHPGVQSKLLVALQERTFRRIGEDAPLRRINARIIAGTNTDSLDALVATGGMRDDLLDRLAGVVIAIPTLEELIAGKAGALADISNQLAAQALAAIRGDGSADTTMSEYLKTCVFKAIHGHSNLSPNDFRVTKLVRQLTVSLAPDALGYLDAKRWDANHRGLENAIRFAILCACETDGLKVTGKGKDEKARCTLHHNHFHPLTPKSGANKMTVPSQQATVYHVLREMIGKERFQGEGLLMKGVMLLVEHLRGHQKRLTFQNTVVKEALDRLKDEGYLRTVGERKGRHYISIDRPSVDSVIGVVRGN